MSLVALIFLFFCPLGDGQKAIHYHIGGTSGRPPIPDCVVLKRGMLHVQRNVCINILCLYPHNTLNIVLLFFCCAMIRSLFNTKE